MEQPRPQPKSSQTLFYFLIFATLSQLVGDWLTPTTEETNTQSDREEERTSKASESAWASLGGALRWAPAKSEAFLPKLFRSKVPIEEGMIVEEVNDDLLISTLADNTAGDTTEEDSSTIPPTGRFRMGGVEIEEYREEIDPSIETILITQELLIKTKSTQSDTSAQRSPSHEIEASSVQRSKPDLAEVTQTETRHEKARVRDKVQKAQLSATQVKSKSSKTAASETGSTTLPSKVSGDLTQLGKGSDQVTKESKQTQSTLATRIPATKVKIKPKKVGPKKGMSSKPKRRRSTSGVTLYSIEDARGVLRPLYKKLAQVKQGQGKVHIVHYGDSLIAGDYVTRTVRRLLQKAFGDGGHGFFLAGKGSRWYGRRWVELKSYGKWTKNKMTRPRIKDRLYGLGGVSFRTSRKGAWVQARPTGQRLGGIVDRFELFYLTQPKGGSFNVSFAGQTQEVSTVAETTRVKRLVMNAKRRGAHSARVKVKGNGEVRLFGFVFERRKAGVVYDALGLEGVRARLLLSIEYTSWLTQLKQRQPDLYILHYGTNESENADLKTGAYKDQLRQVVRRFKRALPSKPCLLMSPMDRAKKNPETGRLSSMRVVERIVRAQREVALESGCAFWSAYDAMGGRGSMVRWYRSSPKLAGGDLTHPTGMGANRLGAMFFAALMEGYRKTQGGK